MVLLLPSGAIAQCNPRGFSSDQSDAIGNVRLQSSTNPVEIASNASAGRTVRASFIVIAIQQGANYPLTSAEDGVALDIDGDGDLDRVAWTRPNSNVAFLALDHDGDGRITSGRELFGNFTTPGASHDFTALARLAEETNGGARRHSISADDPLFARLLLWTDSNHNGVSEPSELRPASKKITDIGLATKEMAVRTSGETPTGSKAGCTSARHREETR